MVQKPYQFELKNDADKNYEAIFSKYNKLLQTKLKDKSVLNYLTSHDDGAPYDKERKKPYRTAQCALVDAGASQVYYGDETSRSLIIEGTEGDATLRSFMNWKIWIASRNTKHTQTLAKNWDSSGPITLPLAQET